jgi:hypothetical protein
LTSEETTKRRNVETKKKEKLKKSLEILILLFVSSILRFFVSSPLLPLALPIRDLRSLETKKRRNEEKR